MEAAVAELASNAAKKATFQENALTKTQMVAAREEEAVAVEEVVKMEVAEAEEPATSAAKRDTLLENAQMNKALEATRDRELKKEDPQEEMAQTLSPGTTMVPLKLMLVDGEAPMDGTLARTW